MFRVFLKTNICDVKRQIIILLNYTRPVTATEPPTETAFIHARQFSRQSRTQFEQPCSPLHPDTHTRTHTNIVMRATLTDFKCGVAVRYRNLTVNCCWHTSLPTELPSAAVTLTEGLKHYGEYTCSALWRYKTLCLAHTVYLYVYTRNVPSLTFWPLKMRPIRHVETSGTSFPLTQHHIPAARRSALYRCEGLRTCSSFINCVGKRT